MWSEGLPHATTYIGDAKLFTIAQASNLRLALGDEVIVVDVVGKEANLCTGVTQVTESFSPNATCLRYTVQQKQGLTSWCPSIPGLKG
jgi:hypothetical protein